MLLDCCVWVLGTKRYLNVCYQIKTIACMTVLEGCYGLVMDWLQGYEHDFHSRKFIETFSPQREAVNAIRGIYLTVRWQALHVNYQIPKEIQREIPPGARCFVTF